MQIEFRKCTKTLEEANLVPYLFINKKKKKRKKKKSEL